MALISTIIFSIGIQQLRKMKWKHEPSRKLLRLMCQEVSPLNVKEETDVISVAIFRAIKEGFDEFVSEVVNANPYLIWVRDEQWANIFHQAVLYREDKIFMLLHNKHVKDSVLKRKDDFRNNVLHMAGMSTPSTRFKSIRVQFCRCKKNYDGLRSFLSPYISMVYTFTTVKIKC